MDGVAGELDPGVDRGLVDGGAVEALAEKAGISDGWMSMTRPT